MGDQPALDEEAIVARIRERLRASLAQAPLPAASPRPQIAPDRSAESMQAELDAMLGASDVYDLPARRHGRALTPARRLAERIARKLLSPSLERQVSYNQANHRLVTALRAELDASKAEQQALRRRCEALEAELETIRGTR